MEQELNFNFFNIIIIAGTVQGLIFGFVVLLLKRYKSTPNKYLAQVVIYLSLSNLYYWFLDTNLSDGYKLYEYIYIPWSLLILPMYYYFVVTYLKYVITKKELFYLKLPFIISLSLHLFLLFHKLFFTLYFEISNRIRYYFYDIEEYFSIVFTVYLIYKVYEIIKKYNFENSEFSIKHILVNTKWLKQLLYFGLLICVFWFIIIFYSRYNINSLFNNNSKYFLWISISVLIYWLGYLGIYHSGIFTQRQSIRNDNIQNIGSIKKPALNYSRFEEIDLTIKKISYI